MPGRLVRRLHIEGTTAVQWLLAVLVGAVVTSLTLSAIGTAILLDNSDEARKQREAQIDLTRRIVECTTAPADRKPPERKPAAEDCYVRAQTRQARVLGDPAGPINQVVVLAAYCARVPTNDTQAEIERCVMDRLRDTP